MNTKTAAGETLRQLRVQKGISLEAVQQHLRIPRKFLDAIERNEFDVLPARIYVHGFLRSYCDFLGVDFSPIWAEAEALAGRAAQPENSAAPLAEETAGKPRPDPQPAAAQAKLVAAVAAVAAVAVLALFYAASRNDVVLMPARRPTVTIPPVQQSRPKISLQALKDVWVQIYADDRLKFEGVLPAGMQTSWTADGAIKIKTPSPESLKLLINETAADLKSFPHDPSGVYVLALQDT